MARRGYPAEFRRRVIELVEGGRKIFEYLEIFHDRKRRHSALGMLTPIEYELQRAS